MAKRKPKKKPVEEAAAQSTDESTDPSWAVFGRIDPALKKPTEDYISDREYSPVIARVIERALREFLERQGYWPPKKS
jgi:hypothetical protein